MIDPKKILEAADLEIKTKHLYAGPASADPAIAALAEAMCAAANAQIRNVANALLGVVMCVVAGDHAKANVVLAELAELVGEA
jgi:hypothetical protein